MTELRWRVLRKVREYDAAGEHLSLGILVRTCNLGDRSNAKRVLRDLWSMGAFETDLITTVAVPKTVELYRRKASA